MTGKRFRKTVEDFTCGRCGASVRGDGFTNHCPKCLTSRHVDVNPGDRSAACGGLMEPVGLETGRDGYVVVQRCVRCGHTRKNKAAPEDDVLSFAAALAVGRAKG